MNNLSAPEEVQPSNGEIPIIRRDQITVTKHLGSGLSGDVSVVQIAGRSEPDIWKTPKGYQGKRDVGQEAEIIKYLMRQQPPIIGVARLTGVSADMQNDPYLLKEYIKGTAFIPIDEERTRQEMFLPADLHNVYADKADANSRMRAEWAWSLLNDVLAPVHQAGVVIADFKVEDNLLTYQKQLDDSFRPVTKCVDFSNSHMADDKLNLFPTSKVSDVILFFSAVMERGFNLPACPTSGHEQVWKQWLSSVEQRQPDVDLLAVCQRMAKTDRYGNSGSSIKDGQELRDLFKPVFEKLGTVKSPVIEGLGQLHLELDQDLDLARMVRMDPVSFSSRVRSYVGDKFPALSPQEHDLLINQYTQQSFSNIYNETRARRIFTTQGDLDNWLDQIGGYINSTRRRHGDIPVKLGRITPVYQRLFADLDPDSVWGKQAVLASFQQLKELLLASQIRQFKQNVSPDLQVLLQSAETASIQRSHGLNTEMNRLAEAYRNSLLPLEKVPTNVSLEGSEAPPSQQAPTSPKPGLLKRFFG